MCKVEGALSVLGGLSCSRVVALISLFLICDHHQDCWMGSVWCILLHLLFCFIVETLVIWFCFVSLLKLLGCNLVCLNSCVLKIHLNKNGCYQYLVLLLFASDYLMMQSFCYGWQNSWILGNDKHSMHYHAFHAFIYRFISADFLSWSCFVLSVSEDNNFLLLYLKKPEETWNKFVKI